jgi:hypothetical protein
MFASSISNYTGCPILIFPCFPANVVSTECPIVTLYISFRSQLHFTLGAGFAVLVEIELQSETICKSKQRIHLNKHGIINYAMNNDQDNAD